MTDASKLYSAELLPAEDGRKRAAKLRGRPRAPAQLKPAFFSVTFSTSRSTPKGRASPRSWKSATRGLHAAPPFVRRRVTHVAARCACAL